MANTGLNRWRLSRFHAAALFLIVGVLTSSALPPSARAAALVQTARLFGTVRDLSGSPLQNTTIILQDAQADVRLMTSTNRAGTFEFSSLPAGQFDVDVLSAVQT